MKIFNKQKGFTLFYAVLLTGIVLAVSYSISFTAQNSIKNTRLNLESKHAYFAAESGLDCALYWDISRSDVDPAVFATSTAQTFDCNTSSFNKPANVNSFTFNIPYIQTSSCAEVTVSKIDDMSGGTQTEIISKGYSNCSGNTKSASSLERAVKVQY
jgi:type II secretory pathway pseudopilin PulG